MANWIEQYQAPPTPPQPPPQVQYNPGGDDFVIEESFGDNYHISDVGACFVVAELFGIPFALFPNDALATTFVAGKQIITRIGKPVWFASADAVAQADQELWGPERYTYARWLPRFAEPPPAGFVPAWMSRFMPLTPMPEGPPEEYRENPAARGRRRRSNRRSGHRGNPSCALCRHGQPERLTVWTTRGECSCGVGEKRSRRNPNDEVPPGVYFIDEVEGCCEEHGLSRIVVHKGEEFLAMFGVGTDVDMAMLWDEAQLFVAAYQLFYRDIRPVWASPLQWVTPPDEDDPAREAWDEQYPHVSIGDYGGPAIAGKYPPFLDEGFFVRWYPYHVSAALELAAPPPPRGAPVPLEPTGVAAMRHSIQLSAHNRNAAYAAYRAQFEDPRERQSRRKSLGSGW